MSVFLGSILVTWVSYALGWGSWSLIKPRIFLFIAGSLFWVMTEVAVGLLQDYAAWRKALETSKAFYLSGSLEPPQIVLKLGWSACFVVALAGMLMVPLLESRGLVVLPIALLTAACVYRAVQNAFYGVILSVLAGACGMLFAAVVPPPASLWLAAAFVARLFLGKHRAKKLRR